MFCFNSHLGAFLATAAMLSTAHAFQSQTKSADAESDPVILDEQQWIILIEEPVDHLKEARESFLRKDTKAAAAEIRKAGEAFETGASHFGEAARSGVEASARELDRLASDVKDGTVNSVTDLDRAFAKAYHSLTKYHILQASDAWAQRETRQAGHALRAAATYLEHGFESAGHAMDTGARKTLNVARDAAGTLIEGSGLLGKDIGAAIEKFGTETKKFGQSIEPNE